VRLDILKTDGFIESVNESMQQYALLHLDQLSEWVSHLPIIDFYYKFSTNYASTHFLLFGVYYQHQPATLLDRLLKVIGAPGLVADHLSKLACV
jgi:hypothetical protein